MLSFFAYRTHTTANKDQATRSERSSWMNRPCGLKYFFSLRLVVFKTEEDEDSPEAYQCSFCDSIGTQACNATGCICHPNVEGEFCQNCTCGFGQIQDGAGCELCDCDTNGTIACTGDPTTCGADRVVCDQISGECACKTNVMGPRCDTCKPGFHSLSCSNGDGCTACDCPPLTTSSSICDVDTGACSCLPGLSGSRCNEILPGFYVPGIEGIIHEGEFATLSGAEIEVNAAPSFTGSGCARFGDVGDKAVFEIPVPSRTIRYRLVLRYLAGADTGEVEVTVTRSGSGNYSCPSGDSVSGQNVLDTSFTLLASSDFIEVQAAGTCLQASDTITVTVSHLTASANWCLDSVVLIPLQDDIQDVIIPSSEVALAVFSFSICYTPRTNELTAPTGNCLQFSIEVTAWLFGGAIECGCSPNGTDPTSIGECAPFSGACTCKSNVLPGGKCDTCKDEFFGLSTSLAAGCQACPPCLSSTSTSSVCDKETGQCSCKSGLTGQACDQVMPGYFVHNLEGVYYEGEDAQLMGPKAVTPSDPSMLSGRACAQFKAVGDSATIRLQVPLQTIRYRLLMRYTADANTGIVDFTVTREGNSNYSCDATSVSVQNLFETSFTLTSTAADVIDIAPDLCLEANDTVILTVTQTGAPSDWCLDAVHLMPLEAEFGNDVKNNDLFVFPGCYNDRLTELGPPSNPLCEPFTVRAAGFLFDGGSKCDCSADGANNSAVCQMFGGQCDCFERVNGRTCSRCEYQFFNLSSGMGCEACNCFENGTNPDSCLECNQLDGTCECKANVEPGGKCTTCKDEFFGLRGDNSDGCTACGCSVLTATSLTCDKETGQCPCIHGLQGRTCTEIKPGFYVPNLEGIIYEGEDAQLMGPEAVTPSNPSDISGRACAQFKAVGNIATFQLRVPLQTIRYRLRMRYTADADTGNVDFTVTREGNSNYSCGATSVSGQDLFQNEFTLTSNAIDDVDVAQDLCLEANDTIILTVTQTGASSDWCLDAVHLMPLEAEFGNDVKNNDLFVFPGCYNDRLTELGSPSNSACEPFTFRAAAWLFGRAFECSCDAVGANNSNTCEAFGGQCDCFDGVIGRTCSECEHQFFNLTSVTGCQACNCFENGTDTESFLKCDQMDGTCTCKASVEGDKCTVCKDGFFNLAENGCEPCVCSSVTTTSSLCNKETGQCGCKRGLHGEDCEQVLSSFYVPGLEGIIYEGEDAQLMGPKAVSLVDSSMLSGSACAQFKAVGDKATIRLQVPLQTIRYRLRMRYTADADTGNVDFTVTREGNSNYSCGATSVSGQDLFQNEFTLTSNAIDDVDVAQDLCLEANDTIILTVTQTGASSDWCLDAVHLMALEAEFGNDVKNNDLFVFPGCYNDRLTELGSPSNSACEPFTVRAAGWLFDGAFECNCDSVGANNANLCQAFGGQCDCADSVIGRTCSECGYKSFNFTSSGCQACDCVEVGTNPSCPCNSTTGECLCKDNFTGERCHLCKSGFKREVVNGDESIPCVPCECNGHSSVCHPLTGVCMNCSNNTIGDFCEECEDGFFGNATSGGSCQACMCNHPLGSNSTVCNKMSGDCTCNTGFVNRVCDACGDGFFYPSIGCPACNCTTGNTKNMSNVCNKMHGQCPCVDGVAGRTCDVCRPGFIGSPPNCTDCGQCFSNWTALIDKLLCKLENLSSNYDMLVFNFFNVDLKLQDFVQCVKSKLFATVENVEACLSMMYDGRTLQDIADDLKDLQANLTSLHDRLTAACDALNANETYIKMQLEQLNETRLSLEAETSRLSAFFDEIERQLNETDAQLEQTSSFNGTVKLTNGMYTDADKLSAMATSLNDSATTVRDEAENYLAMAMTEKESVTAAETKALQAQATVEAAVQKAEHAANLTAMAEATKKAFEDLHANNTAKLNELEDDRDDVKAMLEMYLERAQNATKKATMANDTAEQAGIKTQDKYMAAMADRDLADSLKENASVALNRSRDLYDDATAEADSARAAYEKANSTLADVRNAKEKLESSVADVMEAERTANATLDVTLPPVETIRTLSRQINETIVPEMDIIAVEKDANASLAKARRVQRLATHASEVSQDAADLVQDVETTIGEESDKRVSAEQLLNATKDEIDNAKALLMDIDHYADRVHEISTESKAIGAAALDTLTEVEDCRQDAIGTLNSALAAASAACDLTTEINQNVSAVTMDSLALRDSNAVSDADSDKNEADDLLGQAQDHHSDVSAIDISTLMDLLNTVMQQKERLTSQEESVLQIENRINTLQLLAEEQCSDLV